MSSTKKLEKSHIRLKTCHTVIDSVTSGLWTSCPQPEALQLLEGMVTTRVIATNQFNFDSNQTENLVNLIFSSKNDVRAKAKLNLAARLDQRKFQRIIQEPNKVLEIVLAEAMITQEEALYLVFPKSDKSDGRYCPQCNVAISLGRAVYHERCSVIRWLEKHCRFTYDEPDSCLTPKNFICPYNTCIDPY